MCNCWHIQLAPWRTAFLTSFRMAPRRCIRLHRAVRKHWIDAFPVRKARIELRMACSRLAEALDVFNHR